MHKDFFASSLNVKWIGFIGLLYILTSLFCIDLPDPDNASNSGVKIILESSGGFISDQLIIDTVENDVKISVIHYFPSYIKSTALQIITNEGTMEWDTTLISNSREYSDTINVSKKIMTAGDKKVIATIFIEDNALRTDTVLLNVVNRASVTTGNIAPSWDISDTLTLKLTPGTQFSLKLNDTCFDQNGDLLAYTLLNGNLLQDTIIDFVYSYTAIVADTGTSVVKIIARDTGNLSDTLIIKLSVELPALSDAALSSVGLSAGTLLLQNEPVPDTIRDTVSWIDSSISITPVARDTLATILINEKKVTSGKSAEAILLTEGVNTISITVTSQGSASKVYTLIVIRKPNSTITLTSPPEGVAAAALPVSSIRISWNSLSGANSYTVQRSSSEAGTFETIGTTGSNSYIDTGLTAATPYFYHVNASNSASSTGYSTVVNATTLAKLTIRSQAQDTAVQVGSAVTITVEVTGSNPQFEWSKDNAVMTSQPGSGSLSLTAVTTGNAGVYSVKVRNESDSVVSTPIRLRVLPKTPAAPVVTVRSATSCNVSWSAVDGALWYKVVRSVNSGSFASICSTAQISVIDTPLVAGGNYSYRVIAGNNDGMSDTSSAVSSTTWNPPVITTSPQSVTVPAGQTITLSVVATGDPACTYLWKKGDTPLEGKTESILTIPQATTAHGGIYTVVVTNSAGSTEKSATVTVLSTYTLTITGPLPAGCSVTKQKDTAVYVAGSQVTLTANAAGSNYRFDGWSGDTTASANPLKITMSKNTTVSANFKRQFTVTYAGNNNSRGNPPVATVHDTNATIVVASNTGNLQRDGFDFEGWNTLSNGSGTNYVAGTGTLKISENVTLYAKWTPVKCQVSFSTYGGTSVPVQTVNQGSLLNEPVSTRSGITLVGWYRDASYQNRWNFATQQVTTSITLHAKWLVMDRDENVYDTVRIGDQTWMVQNLRTTKYNDGTPITMIEDSVAWMNRTSAAFCWPYNMSVHGATYGALYNKYAADAANIAPSGWRLPTRDDFQKLLDYIIARGEPPESALLINGSNSSGFSGAPGPIRSPYLGFQSTEAIWWNTGGALAVGGDPPYWFPGFSSDFGLNIRCIKIE